MAEHNAPGDLFPYNSVVGIVDDVHDVHAAADALSAAGFNEDNCAVLSGRRGVEIIDASGKRHGILGKIFKAIDRLGSEHDETEMHVRAIEAGNYLIVVNVHDEAGKTRAHEILKNNNAHHVRYYSKWTTEDLA